MSESLKFDIDEITEEEVADIPSSFNPLQAPLQERNYNKINTKDVGEIEEPNFTTDTQFDNIDNVAPVLDEEIEEEIEEPKEKIVDKITNEGVNELEGKEKKMAVKQLVATVLDGYAMLHELGKKYVVYPEDKLQEKILSGEIDGTSEIPIDENTTVTPSEFIQGFNEQARESISYDEEFGDKVRPAMERVFAKKGWGMTDEQFLLVCFGQDIAYKGVQIMTLRKTANGIMNTFAQLQKEKLENQAQEVVRPDTIQRPEKEVVEEPQVEEVYQEETPQEFDI